MPSSSPAFFSFKFLSPVLGIAVIIGGWLFSYATSQAKTNDHERRINRLETDSINRNEYNELIKRLDRIENKVDKLQESKPK